MTKAAGRSRDAPRRTYDQDGLLDIAVGVFLERGYDGASIAHIASAAGLGKSSIYHHFASKEDFLRRGIERALTALFGVLDEPEVAAGPAIESLRHVVRRAAEITIAMRAEVALLLRVRGNTETERWALGRRREFDRLVAELARRAIDDGDLRGDLDPALCARLIFGMTNSLTEWYRPGRRLDVEALTRSIDAIVFGGVDVRPAARKRSRALARGSAPR